MSRTRISSRLVGRMIFTPSNPARPFASSTLRSAEATKDWEGRQPEEHVANQDHHIDIHSSASVEGRNERSSGSRGESASTEKDHKTGNQRAKKDHPEAPGPVIGMNDERGGVSIVKLVFGQTNTDNLTEGSRWQICRKLKVGRQVFLPAWHIKSDTAPTKLAPINEIPPDR